MTTQPWPTTSIAISKDRARISELFSIPAKAWWDSSDDPYIRLLTVTPADAASWDGRGKVAGMISMTIAAATHGRPKIADNKKISMR